MRRLSLQAALPRSCHALASQSHPLPGGLSDEGTGELNDLPRSGRPRCNTEEEDQVNDAPSSVLLMTYDKRLIDTIILVYIYTNQAIACREGDFFLLTKTRIRLACCAANRSQQIPVSRLVHTQACKPMLLNELIIKHFLAH